MTLFRFFNDPLVKFQTHCFTVDVYSGKNCAKNVHIIKIDSLYIHFFNFDETMIPFTIKFDSVRNISCRLILHVLVLLSIPNSPASGI